MADEVKRRDQIALLKGVLQSEITGKRPGMFTYPNCGYDLVRQHLVTSEGKITVAGKAALWLLGEAPDPTDGASFTTFSLQLSGSQGDKP